MKLVASEPVTILADRVDRRYIPHVAAFPSGLLRLNIGIGPDNHFTPGQSYHSYDGGKTWMVVENACPRIEWCDVFSDGSYYEVDDYWFHDPDQPGWYWGNAGFSTDGGRSFTKEHIRMHAPHVVTRTLRSMRQMGQPQNPWFDLINRANHDRPVSLDSALMGGAPLTCVIELDTPSHLLAVGYDRIEGGGDKRVVMLFESTDAGRTWLWQTDVMRLDHTPEGADEAALVRLDSGELYVMARTGALMHDTRSADGGKTWSTPQPVRLTDSGEYLTGVWPIVRKLRRGGLAAVFGRPKSTFTSVEQADAFDYVAEHYGHCGKFVMVDPTGTGKHWQGRIDLHQREVDLQTRMGVPPHQQLRVQEDTNVRDSNSWEYLSLNEVADDILLVTYDVQRFRENWNSHPVQGVRMVRLTIERG